MEQKPHSYKTLAGPSEAVLFTDRKSKFYGYAFPINKIEAIKPLIEDLWQKYPKANHVCYAWQLGMENVQYRINDDGEPRNSAGSPIYGQIQSFEVTNVFIAVVRIFGGTKLGVGGLIHAYRTTAKLALEASTIIEKRLKVCLELTFDYQTLDRVMRTIKRQKLEVISQNLEMHCSVVVQLNKTEAEKILEILGRVPGLVIKKLD